MPRPGRVKTRLVPPLTESEAAGLYAGFLRDIVGPVEFADAFCYAWPPGEMEDLRPLIPAAVELRAQYGADLWERMTGCFRDLFGRGYERVVVRNTDSPDLPVEVVERAVQACGPGRIVLGPDRGGGYYLIGASAPPGDLLGVAAEGDATVFDTTCDRARELGIEVVVLPEFDDVDEFDDLLELWRRRLDDGRD